MHIQIGLILNPGDNYLNEHEHVNMKEIYASKNKYTEMDACEI